jgi:FtsP/CotA-like multicopper oxidase with cupredoxin domain
MKSAKLLAPTLLALVLSATPARAQAVTCPAVKPGEELRDLPEIKADRAAKKLDTTLRVQLRELCLPTFQAGAWLNLSTQLRAYGYPDPANPGQWVWGYPGPVLRLRKASFEGGQGDSLSILLRNELPAGSGDNDTNLHFHGSHVSPQVPQDDVLLELRPQGAAEGPPLHRHGGEGELDQVFYGQVQYRLDPFLWTQPEGTHWYHPHKHGSVSLQVVNGMAGPLVVEGPFDDWLSLTYAAKGTKLVEKILVLQQVDTGANLDSQGDFARDPLPAPLVNGQAQPVVTMAPGEVQRWRFANAGTNALSQLSLQFPTGAVVRQIAMDGVRFAPENYVRQPLLSQGSFQIAPGNRADFLVQAPVVEGDHPLTWRVFGHLAERQQARADARDEALKPGPADPALVTIRVRPGLPGATPSRGFPDQDIWPPMPAYLRDIRPEEIQGTVNLSFNMTHPNGDPRAEFNISGMSGMQFDGSCVNVTTTLDTALEWNVRNTTDPLHPFHIHTNPFQVIRDGGRTYTPPYVWQDTIPLPAGSAAAPASVLLRHRYTDFTGEYVLHCHFLGHEDRGMMVAVQTVCPKDPGSFGKARPGGQPECVAGNLIEASPRCPAK